MVDRITPEQRSVLMSKIKSKDTGIEKKIRSALHKQGLRFRLHERTLPGKPDIVFIKKKIAIFVDGDFWHGYRFNAWKNKLPDFWKVKIAINIKRDKNNFNKLRKMGWKVFRIWEHQIEKDFDNQTQKIIKVFS